MNDQVTAKFLRNPTMRDNALNTRMSFSSDFLLVGYRYLETGAHYASRITTSFFFFI